MGSKFSPASTVGKWLGLVTAVWVQAISGNNYTFSNYSGALKSLMALTQLQLNNLSVAKDIGKAFGIFAGLASDRLSTPIILLIGSIEGLIGYGVQWLVVSRRIQPLPYWAMCIFLCMGGNSSTWMNTAILVTCIRNFRQNRGPVSGILKGYVGLSTAIFTDLSTALFAADPAKFLIMLAIIPLIVCLSAIIFLREIPPPPPSSAAAAKDSEETKCFWIVNILAVIIAFYLLAYDLSGKHGRLFSRIFVAILVVLLISPVALPIYLALRKLNKSEAVDAERNVVAETQVAAPVSAAVVELSPEEVGERRRPVLGEEHTIVEALRTVEFWLLFVTFLCGVGTGLAVMNNLGQMGLALGYKSVSVFVSLTSIFGFFGRIISGTLSEYFINRWGTSRSMWNAASQVLMAVGYVLLALAMPGSLYLGSALVGICYGVRLAISTPIASELFGLKYYGLMYNILILNLPLGSFLFSGLLAGFLYDKEATSIPGGGNTCSGAHCYRLVFVVMAIACVVGFVLDVVLAIRTKGIYSKIYASRKLKAASSAS